MTVQRRMFLARAFSFAAMTIAVALFTGNRAQTQEPSIVGAWTLNKDLSDQTPDRQREGDQRDSGRGNGGYGRGGRGHGGGFGGGYGGGRRGGGGGGGGNMNPDDMVRMREAMRDIMTAADHLTITQTESMIVVTTQDGRTTRLSPDGKKVKDENTKIERKTKWDAGTLVSEISGLGPKKITETYAIDPETHRLSVMVRAEAPRGQAPITSKRVYDADDR